MPHLFGYALHPVAYVLLPAVALLLFGRDMWHWWRRERPRRGFEVEAVQDESP